MASPGFNVQEVDASAEARRRRLRLSLMVVAAVVALAAVGGLAWYLTPPAMPETVEQAKAVVNSHRFERLSKKDKQPYYDVIREQFGSLDREERRALMQNDEQMRDTMRDAWGSRMDSFAQQYLVTAPEDRAALFQGMRPPRRERPERKEGEQPEARPENRERGDDSERSRRRGERMNNFMSNGSAQTMQAMGEMHMQMRHQREKSGETRR